MEETKLYSIHMRFLWRHYPFYLEKFHSVTKTGKGIQFVTRSNSHEEGGSAQQTVSVVRLPNSQGECRTILASDRKYNIL